MIAGNPEWQKEYGGAWDIIAAVQARQAELFRLSVFRGFRNSRLATFATRIVTYAAEIRKPDAERIDYPERLSGPKTLRLDHLVAATHLASSVSEIRRLILQGGIYIDEDRVADPYQSREVHPGDELVIRKGRREYRVLRFLSA